MEPEEHAVQPDWRRVPPSSGRILDGRDYHWDEAVGRSRIGIGTPYQVPKPAHMSVFENVLVAAVHGGKMTVARARGECDAVLRRVGLLQRAEVRAGRLGLLDMKQLELAKAPRGEAAAASAR